MRTLVLDQYGSPIAYAPHGAVAPCRLGITTGPDGELVLVLTADPGVVETLTLAAMEALKPPTFDVRDAMTVCDRGHTHKVSEFPEDLIAALVADTIPGGAVLGCPAHEPIESRAPRPVPGTIDRPVPRSGFGN